MIVFLFSGPIVTSVIGSRIPRYILLGETVSVAAKMEAFGKPARIHVSEMTHDIVADAEEFLLEERVDRNIMVSGADYVTWGSTIPNKIQVATTLSYHNLNLMTSLRGRTRTFWLTSPTTEMSFSNDSSNRGPLPSNNDDDVIVDTE
ncbi:receptor-type guanylate cyclase gcy-28-like [Gigantopelta aegis]|uniref:receptor-type guanylate cyclase gcy-28-like n=1 Tax=Gigantopelta aegis TaxID=1735272 RepID=UPI001B88E2B8|nr:receptor-type guanylate cyclase gcy-28-like [Gigantopelta aegis]